MNDDLHAIPKMKKIIEFLCDVEVVMGLTFIMPMSSCAKLQYIGL
jgi:hypothetical protein